MARVREVYLCDLNQLLEHRTHRPSRASGCLAPQGRLARDLRSKPLRRVTGQVSKKNPKCDETPSGTRYKRYGRFQCFHSVSMDTSES